MKKNMLLQEIQKLPKFKKEVQWFLNKYPDTNTLPWKENFKKLYVDFEILLPSNLDYQEIQNFIGLTISLGDYNLIQGGIPRQYLIIFNGEPILNAKSHIVNCTANMIAKYYNADKKNENYKLEEEIEEFVKDWNTHPFVKQEEVINLLVPEISQEANISPGLAIKIIGDFKNRIDTKIVWNYYSCLAKFDEHFDQDSNLKDSPEFFNFIVDQFINGGKDLKSKHDFYPQYSGIKPN